MLCIAQAGEAGKTKYLFDMHRLRKRVFKDRMGWDVSFTEEGLEVDQFDIDDAVYLLALNDEERVVGNWRLLPSTGPTMIRDVWPQFLESIEMPSKLSVWEASRFAVDSPDGSTEKGIAQVNQATKELFVGLVELCMLSSISQVITMYDMRIARLLKRLDCHPTHISKKLDIGGHVAQVGLFDTNREMLHRLRKATQICEPLLNSNALTHKLNDTYGRLNVGVYSGGGAWFPHAQARVIR